MAHDINIRTIEVLNKSPESIEALKGLLDSSINPIACAAYADGTHCDNEARNQVKVNLWAPRAEEGHSLYCYVLLGNGKPAGFVNFGLPGTPATVTSTHEPSKMVSEVSGLFLADWANTPDFRGYIIERLKTVTHKVQTCKIDKETQAKTECGSLFLTFKPGHYQEHILAEAGFKHLTPTSPFGLHPERFKFVDEQLFECKKYDQSAEKVQHDNWHDSHPCIEWTEKTAMFAHLPGSDKETTLKSDIGA